MEFPERSPLMSARNANTPWEMVMVQAMLIQADWFQPDAPELAPGIAVAQVGETSGDETIWTPFRPFISGSAI